jgi:MoxR-like ATPase
MQVLEKFLAVREDLNDIMVERESAIDSAILALLCGEHCMLLGPPGTGKSFLIRALCDRIEDAKYFEKLMQAFTNPDELYGPLDMALLANESRYHRREEETLSAAHIAFLDEVPRGSSEIQSTLLTIMNERILQEPGMPRRKVPLLSLYGAANSLFSEDGAALADRFLMIELVEDIKDEDNFLLMVTGDHEWRQRGITISLEDIYTAQAEVDAVKIEDDALVAYVELRRGIAEASITVSPRRWGWGIHLLRAWAWLSGDTAVSRKHLSVMCKVLWNDTKDKKRVELIVAKVTCPLFFQCQTQFDAITETMATLPHVKHVFYVTAAESVLLQVHDAVNMMQDTIDQSYEDDKEKSISLLDDLKALQKALKRTHNKMAGTMADMVFGSIQ